MARIVSFSVLVVILLGVAILFFASSAEFVGEFGFGEGAEGVI
jgi:hypothetical protein